MNNLPSHLNEVEDILVRLFEQGWVEEKPAVGDGKPKRYMPDGTTGIFSGALKLLVALGQITVEASKDGGYFYRLTWDGEKAAKALQDSGRPRWWAKKYLSQAGAEAAGRAHSTRWFIVYQRPDPELHSPWWSRDFRIAVDGKAAHIAREYVPKATWHKNSKTGWVRGRVRSWKERVDKCGH